MWKLSSSNHYQSFSYSMKNKSIPITSEMIIQNNFWEIFSVFLFISIYLLNVQCGHTKSTIMNILRFFVYFLKFAIQ